MNGPRFLPSGRRFGPYFRSRAEASAASSPFSPLVASCFTTSSADIACHVAASLSVFALVATLMPALRWVSSSLSRPRAHPRRIITRRYLIMAMFALRHVWTAPWQSVGAVTCPASHRQIRRPYWQLKRKRPFGAPERQAGRDHGRNAETAYGRRRYWTAYRHHCAVPGFPVPDYGSSRRRVLRACRRHAQVRGVGQT